MPDVKNMTNDEFRTWVRKIVSEHPGDMMVEVLGGQMEQMLNEGKTPEYIIDWLAHYSNKYSNI